MNRTTTRRAALGLVGLTGLALAGCGTSGTEDLAEQARTVQFPGLDGVLPGFGRQEHNDWGLGMEIRDHKSPHWTAEDASPDTFGHFGQSGSFVWVDPGADLTAVFLGERSFRQDTHAKLWPRLNAEILASHRG